MMVRKYAVILLAIIFSVIAKTPDAFSQKLVNRSQVKKTSVQYKGRKVTIQCLKNVPGSAVKRPKNKLLFTPFNIQAQRLKLRSQRSAKQKLQNLNRLGKPKCRSINKPSPTPTPTPTPTFPGGNFDGNGNVTEQGKITFKIPFYLDANITDGRDVFEQYCVGCHEQKTNRDFVYVRGMIANSPMNYSEEDIPDWELAQIIAFLNRFRF